MEIQALLPDSGSLDCDRVVQRGNQVVVMVSGDRSLAACPACGGSSDRVHSQYVRRLADLPWQGLRVEVQWRCRRFFCTNPHCRQQIFSERLPEVAEPYARKTRRLTVILRAIAFACGGEEGARLLDRLAIPASPDTLLREIRRTEIVEHPAVKVVGVDDWALRRGQRYGTILVDLEQHCPVDLLPVRSAEAVAAWLQDHPEVEIVSRDRGDCYIKGAGQAHRRRRKWLIAGTCCTICRRRWCWWWTDIARSSRRRRSWPSWHRPNQNCRKFRRLLSPQRQAKLSRREFGGINVG